MNNTPWQLRRTTLVFGLMFMLIFAVLAGRLVQIQLRDQAKLKALAYQQQTARREIPPFRGAIVDSRFRPLALDVECYSIFADPFLINQTALERAEAANRSSGRGAAASSEVVSVSLRAAGDAERVIERRLLEVSELLSPVLDVSAEFIRGEMARRSDRRFVWLKRRVDRETRDRVLALKIRGIGVEAENKRHYPSDGLAAQVIGSVGIDNQGVSALEYYLDDRLRGEAGHFVARLDGKRRQVWVRPGDYHSAADGQMVVLTIDLTIDRKSVV